MHRHGAFQTVNYLMFCGSSCITPDWYPDYKHCKNAFIEEDGFSITFLDPICALGTCFSYDRIRCEKENFSNKVNQIKKLFNLWSQRDLTLYGKITIARSLVLSKLIFGCAYLPTPAHIIDIVNKMVIELVWSHKRPKIKKETLIGGN